MGTPAIERRREKTLRGWGWEWREDAVCCHAAALPWQWLRRPWRGREVGLQMFLAEMSLAERFAALLDKVSQLGGPPGFRELTGTAKRNRRFRRLEHYRREVIGGFRKRKRRVRAWVGTKRRDCRTENIPASFLEVVSWRALVRREGRRKRNPSRNGEMI